MLFLGMTAMVLSQVVSNNQASLLTNLGATNNHNGDSSNVSDGIYNAALTVNANAYQQAACYMHFLMSNCIITQN